MNNENQPKISRRDFIKLFGAAAVAAGASACGLKPNPENPFPTDVPGTDNKPTDVAPDLEIPEQNPVLEVQPTPIPSQEPAVFAPPQEYLDTLKADYVPGRIDVLIERSAVEIPMNAVSSGSSENVIGVDTNMLRESYMLVPLVQSEDNVMGAIKDGKAYLPRPDKILSVVGGELQYSPEDSEFGDFYVYKGGEEYREFVPKSATVSVNSGESIAAVISNHPDDSGTMYYVWMNEGRITSYMPAVFSGEQITYHDTVYLAEKGWRANDGVVYKSNLEGDRWAVTGVDALARLQQEVRSQGGELYGSIYTNPSNNEEQYAFMQDGQKFVYNTADIRRYPSGVVVVNNGENIGSIYAQDGRWYGVSVDQNGIINFGENGLIDAGYDVLQVKQLEIINSVPTVTVDNDKKFEYLKSDDGGYSWVEKHIYNFWEGEDVSWKLMELDKELQDVSVAVEGSAAVLLFYEDGVEYAISLDNNQGAQNVRLMEHNYRWPVVVGEVNGETMAYDPINEAFLPMWSNYSEYKRVGERAVEELVRLGKLQSLDELASALDWSKVRQIPTVGKLDGHDNEYYYSAERIYNTFYGGVVRLYGNNDKYLGHQVTLGRMVFDGDQNLATVGAKDVLGLFTGTTPGGSDFTPGGEGWLGGARSLDELMSELSIGDYVKVNFYYSELKPGVSIAGGTSNQLYITSMFANQNITRGDVQLLVSGSLPVTEDCVFLTVPMDR